jgi:hypothetical protein
MTLEQGQEEARKVGINMLATIKAEIGDLDRDRNPKLAWRLMLMLKWPVRKRPRQAIENYCSQHHGVWVKKRVNAINYTKYSQSDLSCGVVHRAGAYHGFLPGQVAAVTAPVAGSGSLSWAEFRLASSSTSCRTSCLRWACRARFRSSFPPGHLPA